VSSPPAPAARRTWSILGAALTLLGVLLLIAAPVLRFAVYPSLRKAPLTRDERVISTGTGAWFDLLARGTKSGPLTSTRTIVGKPSQSVKGAAVWETTNTLRSSTGAGVGLPLSETVTFDRTTSAPIPLDVETPKHDSFVLKFPFGTERKTYDFWDDIAQRSFPAEYKGESTVKGVRVYVFTQVIAPAPAPKQLGFDAVYSNSGRTVYVEPTTGVIVRGVSHPKVVLTGTPLGDIPGLDASLEYDDATQAHFAKTAKDCIAGLRLVRTTLPLGSLVAGSVLLAVGVVLVVRRRRSTHPA
jgi:hypothetical protein